MEVYVHFHRNRLALFNAIAPLSGKRNRTAVIISRSKDVLDVQHGTGLIRLIAKLPTKENLAGVSLRSIRYNKLLHKSKTVLRLISRRRARYFVHVVLHAVCNRVSRDVEMLYDCLHVAYCISTFMLAPSLRGKGVAIKRDARELIPRLNVEIEVNGSIGGLDRPLVYDLARHSTFRPNGNSARVEVRHYLMVL